MRSYFKLEKAFEPPSPKRYRGAIKIIQWRKDRNTVRKVKSSVARQRRKEVKEIVKYKKVKTTIG